VKNTGHTSGASSGHAIFKAKLELGMLVDDPSLSKWTIHMQRWPRDVNLHTGLWSDVASWVSSRDAAVFNAQGAGIPANEFLRRLHENDNDPFFAAIRWFWVTTTASCRSPQREASPKEVSLPVLLSSANITHQESEVFNSDELL
jgi:hypothetical protein